MDSAEISSLKSTLKKEVVFLLLQFLNEEGKYKETVHKLEQESGLFFNRRHFGELVLAGEWEEVERYLSGFTKLTDSQCSKTTFFKIRKQKYLEALDKNDTSKAIDVLMKDLKVFEPENGDLFKELAMLLSLDNFREHEKLSKYGDTKSARIVLLIELKKLIEANPLLHEKLQFPLLKPSRLLALVKQSVRWQHLQCKNPQPIGAFSLFYDHSCDEPNGARAPSPAPIMVSFVPRPVGFSPLRPPFPGPCINAGCLSVPGFPFRPHGPFRPEATNLPRPITNSMASAASGGPLGGIAAPANPVTPIKRPTTQPSCSLLDHHSADSQHVLKRPRHIGVSQGISVSTSRLPISYTNIARGQHPLDVLPKTVVMTLKQGSKVTSMDFHPVQHTLLLVGTNVADISLWEIASRERIAHRDFRVWNIRCSQPLRTLFTKETTVSVNRVIWNSDGNQFATAYSKHLIHLYTYKGGDELTSHLQIDAHVGGVNDVAFFQPYEYDEQLLVTCGDDKTIKVWNTTNGMILYTFDGHKAPVFSVCPRVKENIPFIFSTSVDGEIKRWMYDPLGSKVDYTASGKNFTTMAYSANGERLFSCGTSKDGTSSLEEWQWIVGTVKRSYEDFGEPSVGIPQFDTLKNQYLAAGDDFMIKFWDMDSNNILTSVDAEGGLSALPRIRFSKTGSLLAASAYNCIKILANSEGQMLISAERQSFTGGPAANFISELYCSVLSSPPAIGPLKTSGPLVGTSVSVVDHTKAAPIVQMNDDVNNLVALKLRIVDETLEKQKIWKLTEIHEPSQCRSSRLPDNLMAAKVPRLIYTNSGNAILALASNAVHKLWKWPKTDGNSTGKASAITSPQLWQPSNRILMINEKSDRNTDGTVHCLALSKNDSYVISASGGKISLYNIWTFKTMATFMDPPPAATFLAFHSQDNNIIAIGMADSTIKIYNVRTREVKSILEGHQKRITGLAFSNELKVLISSGADAQLCAWGLDKWDKKGSKFLELHGGAVSGSLAETKVQFHRDQMHLLVVHETQLAIYDATKFECLKQWVPHDGSITHATYSCDSQTIYTSLTNGFVNIFTSNLSLVCRISPTAYLNIQPRLQEHPVVIAAHPSEPNQFALGLTDGGIQVLEPLESEEKWGTMPPAENSVAANAASNQAGASAAQSNYQCDRLLK